VVFRAEEIFAPLSIEGDLRLPIAALSVDTTRLFTCPLDSATKVTFFVRKDENQQVQVGFASCRRCYRFGQRQQGSAIICGSCGNPMPLLAAGERPPAEKDCSLIPVPYSLDHGQVVVRQDDLRRIFTEWFKPVVPPSGP
jgi:uncharacterized membrane protein